MKIFTIEDLYGRTGDLVRNAESSKLSLITKHGQPVFLAVPFDEALVKTGVHVDLALKLFDEEVLSTGQAAKLAGLSLAQFMELCSTQGIPIVRYSTKELESELQAVQTEVDVRYPFINLIYPNSNNEDC